MRAIASNRARRFTFAVHTLFAGESIEAGQSELSTGTGVYATIEDGNFAIYLNDDRLWQTDTIGNITNLVFYESSYSL